MKRVLSIALAIVGAGAILVLLGAKDTSEGQTYFVDLNNAFGLTQGADVKVAGVRAGTIKSFELNPRTLKAEVEIQITQGGFGSFRKDASCETRPQSLIGEYFIDCQPGTSPKHLQPNAHIKNTFTTIAPDLVGDVLRAPERERLRLILNELGAGVAGRAQDLNDAIRRASPALRETDRVLNILASENRTLQDLTVNADQVITALARGNGAVKNFITFANRTSTISAERARDIQGTFQRFPAFLQALRPNMQQLGIVADRQGATLQNLLRSSAQLRRFLDLLVPFSASSKIGLQSLGHSSTFGREAVLAARRPIQKLNAFARHTPELARNLGYVLHDLDDRSRAVELDPRAAEQIGRPGAKVGYTGLEDLLMYVFNQSMAVNSFNQYGHLLKVDAFGGGPCAPFTDAITLKKELAGPKAAELKHCFPALGPNQPGVNQPDPSPPQYQGAYNKDYASGGSASGPLGARSAHRGTGTTPPSRSAGSTSGSSTPGSLAGSLAAPATNLEGTIQGVLSGVRPPRINAPRVPGAGPVPPPRELPQHSQQALLDYLLAP